MFLIKKSILIFIAASLQFYSCSTNKTQLHLNKTNSVIDSTVFLKQFNRYDSFYAIYFKTRQIDFLKLGGHIADSALLSPVISQDSNLYKKYLSLLFYRGIDLNILGDYLECKELLEKYV
jgi:hypothetical protein